MNFLFGRHVLASLYWSQRQKKIFLCLDSLLGVYQQILWLTDVCRYSSCISQYYYHFFKPTSLWIVVDSETWPQAMAKSKFIAPKNDKRRRVLKPLSHLLALQKVFVIKSHQKLERDKTIAALKTILRNQSWWFWSPAQLANVIHLWKRKTNLVHKAKEERKWITYSG